MSSADIELWILRHELQGQASHHTAALCSPLILVNSQTSNEGKALHAAHEWLFTSDLEVYLGTRTWPQHHPQEAGQTCRAKRPG